MTASNENYGIIAGHFPGEWIVVRVTKANKRHAWIETNNGKSWREIRSQVQFFPTKAAAEAAANERETAFRDRRRYDYVKRRLDHLRELRKGQ